MLNRGSEWRRWEPHIHAPGTVLNNQFGGGNAWGSYLTTLEVLTPKIEAVGVTDYYVTDTYEEVIRQQNAGRLPDVKLIFPNIEVRLDVAARSGFVNLHLLVSNPRIIRFQKQSNFWRPHWFIPEIDPFQERLGGRLALVSDATIAGKTIITYNLHLESKGDDQLRESQLAEILADARQHSAATPVLLAGDFNLDASVGNAAAAIRQAQFQGAFANQHVATTPNTFFEEGRAIDWIFSRGPVRPDQPQVHRSVKASDHYPLSIALHFV